MLLTRIVDVAIAFLILVVCLFVGIMAWYLRDEYGWRVIWTYLILLPALWQSIRLLQLQWPRRVSKWSTQDD